MFWNWLIQNILHERTRHMKENTTTPETLSIGTQDILTEILRQGAQQLLVDAIEQEVQDYIGRHQDHRDESGHRQVVRNGHLPQRTLQTPVGDVEVKQPRVNDKRMDENGQRMKFTSNILPPYPGFRPPGP